MTVPATDIRGMERGSEGPMKRKASKPRFRVGQVVALAHSKRHTTFRILEVVEHEGDYFYRWNRNNAAAEHMLRPLTARERGKA